MRKFKISLLLILVSIIFILMGSATAQREVSLKGVFFSTEEDFVTQGTKIISDGDLLNAEGYVYMRNHELLGEFEVKFDLGLDAADVIDIDKRLVAFSTELDHPKGWFTAGDLLATNGAILPNSVLLIAFDIPSELNLGLDALHFTGKREAIIEFLEMVKKYGRKYWLENPKALIEFLEKYGIDIWFSTEGTAPWPEEPQFLDGDLLSAATGKIVAANSDLLPLSVPAGIPKRGVDFGLDAVTLDIKEKSIKFSTEILYEDKLSFTDGDVLLQGDGVTIQNIELINSFEPKVKDLGLDALSIETVTFPEIKIISPKEGDKVPFSIIVSGTFSGKLPEGQYMWLVINPHPSPGQWWPQGRIDPWEEWNIHFWIGQEKEDIGKKFTIAVILVNEKDDQYYRDYLRTGQETGSYPGILLPAIAKIIDRITVMRK